MGSRLKRVMAVVNVCATTLGNKIREFEIAEDGIVSGARFSREPQRADEAGNIRPRWSLKAN
jgi:hypothetical protein